MGVSVANMLYPIWKRNRHGEWVIFGPAEMVVPGEVEVITRSGDVREVEIESVGGAFMVEGIACRYGYLAPARHGVISYR